jgi:hypothetical protein
MLAKIWRSFVAMRPVANSPPYTILGLCYKRADDQYARVVCRDGVVKGVVWVVAEVVETAGDTADAAGRGGGIGIGAEDHVRSAEDFEAVGMRMSGGVS